MTNFKILFWNAGGLTNDKFTELKYTVFTHNIDLLGIVESGASTENLDFYRINGYQTFCLQRARQVASGIIVYIKNTFTANMTVGHSMTDSDKLEVIEINVWREGLHYQVHFLYNPPNNRPNLECLLNGWNRHSLIFGDFKAHSQRWGYSSKILEILSNSLLIQRLLSLLKI